MNAYQRRECPPTYSILSSQGAVGGVCIQRRNRVTAETLWADRQRPADTYYATTQGGGKRPSLLTSISGAIVKRAGNKALANAVYVSKRFASPLCHPKSHRIISLRGNSLAVCISTAPVRFADAGWPTNAQELSCRTYRFGRKYPKPMASRSGPDAPCRKH